MKKYIVLLVLFLSSISSWALQKRVFDLKEPNKIAKTQELKKLESFKLQLKQNKVDGKLYLNEIRQYSKDSLRILAVKLYSIQQLSENNLLATDISLNPKYYLDLLDELKESDIDVKEYSFLEYQLMAYQIATTEHKLLLSKSFNYLFFAIIISLIFLLFYKKKKPKITSTPILSQQELKVKHHILEGKTNKEIAEALFVSVNTVKTHITNIYHKLSVSNRRELLAKYQNSTGTST